MNGSPVSHHITPVRTYVIIFLTLLVLTYTTAKIGEIELGDWNFVVAISIAITKALLVILFFMHAKDSSNLTKMFIGAGFFWMMILILVTLCDYISRPWQSNPVWMR
ncbi:MAG: cytochrome C oxidase subunit IV family protein [Bryobacteraceae bacterium]